MPSKFQGRVHNLTRTFCKDNIAHRALASKVSYHCCYGRALILTVAIVRSFFRSTASSAASQLVVFVVGCYASSYSHQKWYQKGQMPTACLGFQSE